MYGMRNCTNCGSEFIKDSIKQVKCKPCKRLYDRDYHANRSEAKKTSKLQKQKSRLAENKQFVWDYLAANPCLMCGESDPVVLEFDHIDRSSKSGVLSEMSWASRTRIEEEISKCRILCANCHRRHTATQLGWYKDITR